jgi:hypothetical protein
MYIDFTGSGIVIEEMISEMNDRQAKENKPTLNYEPYVFTNSSKMDMIDNLTKRMQDRKIEFSSFYSDQLRTYIRKKTVRGYRFEHDKGCHDDRVDSLLLAAYSKRNYGSDNRNQEYFNLVETTFSYQDDTPYIKRIKNKDIISESEWLENDTMDFVHVG